MIENKTTKLCEKMTSKSLCKILLTVRKWQECAVECMCLHCLPPL